MVIFSLHGNDLSGRELTQMGGSMCDEMEKRPTLDEWNAERIARMEELKHPRFNGISCPKCGHELKDINPMVTLASNPPQKSVNCIVCEYTGYRFC